MNAVIEATGLRKTYGETVALADVSLSVDPGEVYALIGPNGAGKTTLVRALTGTTTPDAGSARVLGTSPTTVDRDRIGVLPQAFSPPERLTARELLVYYAGLYGAARDPDAVLDDVGLADAADTWYEHLSGGQQRRVCVGSALVNDPDVLFLDEPTTGIDPAGRRTVWRLVESLVEGGTTVVLTTHDMAEAERLADRVGLLADGSLVAQGSPAGLVAEHGRGNRLTVDPVDDGVLATADDRLDNVDRLVTTTGGRIVVHDVAPAQIGDLVDALERAGIEFDGIAWSKPTLEDVYLTLADEPMDRLSGATTVSPAAQRTGDSTAVSTADSTDESTAGATTGGERR